MKTSRKYFFANLIATIALGGYVSASATASELPTEKLKTLQCAASGETCCEKWINTVLEAARAETNASSMLNVLPNRVDRWRHVEKRSFCAMKKDIEARDQPFTTARK